MGVRSVYVYYGNEVSELEEHLVSYFLMAELYCLSTTLGPQNIFSCRALNQSGSLAPS